jgi:hypothetical protein
MTTLPTAAAAAAAAAATTTTTVVGVGHVLLKERTQRAGDGLGQGLLDTGPENLVAEVWKGEREEG